MKFPKINIRNEIKLFVLFVLAFSAIAFVERKQDYKKIQELNILIHDQGNNYFLDQEEVHKLVTADNSDFLIGREYAEVDLKAIEGRVRQNEYVSTTQAFKDLSGNLTIEISLCKPIARIIRSDKPDSYICESGKIIPTSEKFTPRVLLISGDYLDDVNSGNLQADSAYQSLFGLVKYIIRDPFWKAQISQINIDRRGDVILYPQVTKQYIEFGKVENVGEKFLKLKYFYKKILPHKGWNHYARVNLEYEHQIICE
jgi:cell division protein FtsQ